MRKLVLLFAVMIGSGAMGQAPGKERMQKEMTAEQVATLRTKRMALSLDLSQDQQAQILALNVKDEALHKQRMQEFKAQRASGTAQALTPDERFAKKNAFLDHQIAQRDAFREILTPEQFQRWKNNRRSHSAVQNKSQWKPGRPHHKAPRKTR